MVYLNTNHDLFLNLTPFLPNPNLQLRQKKENKKQNDNKLAY